ncbi:TY-Chap domain-containing protein [Actinocorallia sp. A-T 12471]|uniref:TY-Chap domain-containing protein n=1 Tax=Actinocorallia sp. A-T 12471 TaxID=3089813 RepID=UPI0029CB13B8|nr:hypothetical protein [Actinocorallia sp. A-T 12471]MDX6739898.1 hypothetical protein [Actinocorallia sp. A-T 12471]
MNWGEFAERLARELAGLDSHMVLVVHRRAEGSHYVQAFRTGDLLHAEAVSSSVLGAALRFDPVAEDRLADIGWQRPESFGNWTYDLSFSSPPDGFREVATLMTIALRDVQRADTPDDLAYESFRGGVFLDLTEFGITPSDPGRATEKHVPPPLPDVPPRLSAVPPVEDPTPDTPLHTTTDLSPFPPTTPTHEPPTYTGPSYDTPYDPPPFGDPPYDGPSYDTPAFGDPTGSGPAHGDGTYDRPTYDGPSYDAPPFGDPAHSDPAQGEQAHDGLSYDAPSFGNPTHGQGGPAQGGETYGALYGTSYDSPAYDAPAFGDPTHDAPPQGDPSYGPAPEAPSQGVPAHDDARQPGPAQGDPGQPGPALGDQTYDAPASGGSPQGGPSYGRSDRGLPPYDGPTAYEPSAYDGPSYDAPAQGGPAHSGPAYRAGHDASSYDGPSYDGPAYDDATRGGPAQGGPGFGEGSGKDGPEGAGYDAPYDSGYDASTGAYALPPLPAAERDDDPLTSGSFRVPRADPYALPPYGDADQDDPLTSGSFSFPPRTPPASPSAQDDPLTSGSFSFPPVTPPSGQDDPLTSGSFAFPHVADDPGLTTTDVPRPSGPDDDPLTSGSFSFRESADAPRDDDPLTSGSFAFPAAGDPGVTLTDRDLAPPERAPDPGEDTARFAAIPDDGPSPAGQTLADVPRPDRRQPDVPAVDVPVAGHPARQPNRTAVRLAEAKANGDRDGYLSVLEGAELYVTGTVIYSDGVYLRAYTSPPEQPHSVTQLRALVADWPQPHWQLAVDDGLPSAGYLDSITLARLAGGVSSRLVMQKVLPHPLVVHYLEGGYDRVAGYVHRVADVLSLTTPKQLYAALGLGHGRASTFSPDDDVVHVLRWHARFGGPLRTPFGGPDEASMRRMPGGWVVEHPPFEGNGFAPGLGVAIPEFKVDSQRLPHGAEIYRFDRSGRRVLVALFDADGTRWAAV